MFVVDGEILNEKNMPKIHDWYIKKRKEIEDSDKKLFVFSSEIDVKYEVDDSGRKRRKKIDKSIPSTTTFFNEDLNESQTWIYVPSANSIKKDGSSITIQNRRPFIIGSHSVFNKKNDFDIIFFLMCLSKSLKRGHIKHIDRDADSKSQAKRSSIAAEAQYVLFHEDSYISPEKTGSEKGIRQIAISFGLPGVANNPIAEVRNSLWDKILGKEKTKDRGEFGFDGFLEAAKKIKNGSKRAVVMTAIELGFLRYKDFKWYIHLKGSIDTVMCSVPLEKEKENKEIVINFVLDNEEYYNLLSISIKDPESNVITNKVPDLSREELIKAVIDLNWPRKLAMNKKNVELKEIIKNEAQPPEVE